MPRRAPRAYSEETKAKAVAQAELNGQAQAARDLGIPKRTLGEWFHDPKYAAMREESRDKVGEAFWTGVQIALDAVMADIASGDASLRDKAVALGIVFDKWALLTGNATSRTESRDLTGTLSDRELVDAVRTADAIARGGRAAPEAEGTPEG